MNELKKYIIEFSEDPHTIRLLKLKNGDKYPVTEFKTVTPYTEPDLEQVRKEAYQQGYEQGYKDGYDEPGKNQQEAYQRGLNDAWECMKKIIHIVRDQGTMIVLFGCRTFGVLLERYTPGECIEKIRQYEQEKDRQARIEYNFDEVKDVIETTAKKYNMSLDEIAEVLKKMGEH